MNVVRSYVNSIKPPALIETNTLDLPQNDAALAAVEPDRPRFHLAFEIGDSAWVRRQVGRARRVVKAIDRSGRVAMESETVTGEGDQVGAWPRA